MAETWFYLSSGQQFGPMGRQELLAAVANGTVSAETYVWQEGMPDWVKAKSVPGLLPQNAAPAAPFQPPPLTPTGQGPWPVVPAYAPPKPANNLGWAIAVTILCCWPAGIPAIVYAAQVDSKWNRGDFVGATQAASNAKTWMLVSFIGGLLATALVILASFLGA